MSSVDQQFTEEWAGDADGKATTVVSAVTVNHFRSNRSPTLVPADIHRELGAWDLDTDEALLSQPEQRLGLNLRLLEARPSNFPVSRHEVLLKLNHDPVTQLDRVPAF